jgi:hypothetical protein
MPTNVHGSTGTVVEVRARFMSLAFSESRSSGCVPTRVGAKISPSLPTIMTNAVAAV